MPFAEIAGARLFFTDDGTGDRTLLLVHQLTGDSHDWSWLLPLLRDHHRVVALDLRGHGRSSKPGTYAIDDLVGDLAGLVGHLGCGPVVPIGHSLGAMAASVLAIDHPALVAGLVSIEPAYSLPPAQAAGWVAFKARWDARSPGADDLTKYRVAPPGSPATPAFLTTWRHRAIQAMDPDVFWAIYDDLVDGPRPLLEAGPAVDAYLRRRTCPVLSFHAHDQRARWEAGICPHPRSRAVGWEGSGHNLQVERAAELAAVILPWLDALDA